MSRLEPRKVSVGTFKTTAHMRELVNQVLDSDWISYGAMSKQFERKFAQIHGCKYAILSNSGTSALQIALQTLKEIHRWDDGKQVIIPATTFVATANIVRHCKLRPVFVDVDERTYNMDMNQVAGMSNYDTVAVIPVHLFGQPADMTRLYQNIDRQQIKVVEDSCETMFATHNEEVVGSLGDIGCFSTYVAHLVVTGVGGISTTNNPDYAAHMRSLVNHGLMIENLNPDENFAPNPMIGRRFMFDKYGHSYRITEFEAALGLAQLEDCGNMLAIRRRNAKHLTTGISNINTHYGDVLQTPMIDDKNTHSWMMYPIVFNKKNGELVDKEPMMSYLNRHGVETRDMMPIIEQPIYNWVHPASYPVSYWILKSGFYVGCHQHLSPEDIQYVVETIEDGINERGYRG